MSLGLPDTLFEQERLQKTPDFICVSSQGKSPVISQAMERETSFTYMGILVRTLKGSAILAASNRFPSAGRLDLA